MIGIRKRLSALRPSFDWREKTNERWCWICLPMAAELGLWLKMRFFFLSFLGFCQYKGNLSHDREVEKGLACNSSKTRHWKGRGMKPRSPNVGISDRQIQTLFKVVRPELFAKVTILLNWGRIESQMYLNISAPLF